MCPMLLLPWEWTWGCEAVAVAEPKPGRKAHDNLTNSCGSGSDFPARLTALVV
jgi:hypothetical protein